MKIHKKLTISFVVVVFTVVVFANVTHQNLKISSTNDLWRQFSLSIHEGNNHTSYAIMHELCERDIDISESVKVARWQSCSSTNREICAHFNNCKDPLENETICISGAATNESALFFLWMNCKTVMNNSSSLVKFGEYDSSGQFDLTGIAFLIKE